MSLDAPQVIGLLAGLPAVRTLFNYRDKRWKLWSDLLSLVHGPVYFLAAARFSQNRPALFALITLAEVVAAFGSTSGARINGTIMPAMRREEFERELPLVDLFVANSNQDRVVGLAGLALSLGALFALREFEIEPAAHLTELASAYALLHSLKGIIFFQRYRSLPALPLEDIDAKELEEIERRKERLRALEVCSPRELEAHIPQLLTGLHDADPAVREAARAVSTKLDASPSVMASAYAALLDHVWPATLEPARIGAFLHAASTEEHEARRAKGRCTSATLGRHAASACHESVAGQPIDES